MTAAAKAARARLLTVPELAERLRISRRSAYRVAREMLHTEIAGRLLVPEPAVDTYVAARLREPTWDASTSAVTPTTPTTSIAPVNGNASRRSAITTRMANHSAKTTASKWRDSFTVNQPET